MRKLSYEQLERREVFATLAAVELPPSPLDVIEASTRDFINSTLKQVAPSGNEAVLQTGPSRVTSDQGGDQIQVTYVVVGAGSAIPSMDSPQVVFTFTVRPNHAVGFHAALRNLATSRTSFPPEAKAETTALVSLNSEGLERFAPDTFQAEESDTALSIHSQVAERQPRTSASNPSGISMRRSQVPLPTELAWQIFCPDSTHAAWDSAGRPSIRGSVETPVEMPVETAGDEPQPESIADLEPQVTPIFDRMSFLAENPQPPCAPQAPQAANASAILQILVGLAGFPATSSDLDLGEADIALVRAAPGETDAAGVSWKAWVVTLGIGFALQARHRERRNDLSRAVLKRVRGR